MSKQRVIISVTNDLCTDQRVNKVAGSLQNAGFEILLVGRKLPKSPSFHASFNYLRLSLLFNKGALFYAEYNIRLFFLLLFSKADIFLANDTDTLPANYLAARLGKKKLVFDAHELFPEVPEVVHRKWIKAFWTKLEDLIFPHLKNSYTVCNSIADYYNKKYGIQMAVVRNVPYTNIFKESTAQKPLHYDNKKIILYQGAINVGRGLEWVIDAMPMIENAVLVIIGDGDIKNELKTQVKSRNLADKVFFIGRIGKDRLNEYTACADLGLCLLENKGLSYYYSLPNRIFDFMQAGVPILASNFPEIAKIVTECSSGRLIEHHEPVYLAQNINEMLTYYTEKDKAVIKTNGKNFVWENEENKLLTIFTSAK